MVQKKFQKNKKSFAKVLDKRIEKVYNKNVQRGRKQKPERQKERLKIMKKLVYRVFDLDPTCFIDRRNGQYKDFNTLEEATEYYNTARNYFDSDIDIIEKAFNPDAFEYTETRIDRIRIK